MFTDPIGDMIARIRNAQMRNKVDVFVPHSVIKVSILDVLIREGYINGYEVIDNTPPKKGILVSLKYFNGKPVIKAMKRISKPSIQKYSGVKDMAPVANGLGNAVVSTSQGVLSDREAKSRNVGGKILLTVR